MGVYTGGLLKSLNLAFIRPCMAKEAMQFKKWMKIQAYIVIDVHGHVGKCEQAAVDGLLVVTHVMDNIVPTIHNEADNNINVI
jgi:hypothetical protein